MSYSIYYTFKLKRGLNMYESIKKEKQQIIQNKKSISNLKNVTKHHYLNKPIFCYHSPEYDIQKDTIPTQLKQQKHISQNQSHQINSNIKKILEKESSIINSHFKSSQHLDKSPKTYTTQPVIQRLRIPSLNTEYLPSKGKPFSFYRYIYNCLSDFITEINNKHYDKAFYIIFRIYQKISERKFINPPLSHDETRAKELEDLWAAIQPGKEISQLLGNYLVSTFEELSDINISNAAIEFMKTQEIEKLSDVQQGCISSKANHPQARYIPNSMTIFIRHGEGIYDNYNMVSDEIEVIFQLEITENTIPNTLNALDIFGIRFEYWETQNREQNQKSYFKVLNSVYVSSPKSRSFSREHIGPIGLGKDNTPRNIDYNLVEMLTPKSYNEINKHIITIGMRDVPGVSTALKDNTQKLTLSQHLGFRIAIEDTYGNASCVFLQQHYNVENGQVQEANFTIGAVENATVHVTNLAQSKSASILSNSSEMSNLTEINQEIGRDFFIINPELNMESLSGPILSNINPQKISDFYKQLFTIIYVKKPNLTITTTDIGIYDLRNIQSKSSGISMAGGLSTNAFDELKYTEFHENIYFVGAYKKNILLYAYFCELSSPLPIPDPSKQYLDILFKNTQYEEIPLAWIRKAISLF